MITDFRVSRVDLSNTLTLNAEFSDSGTVKF